jgi:hypothetical protein
MKLSQFLIVAIFTAITLVLLAATMLIDWAFPFKTILWAITTTFFAVTIYLDYRIFLKKCYPKC